MKTLIVYYSRTGTTRKVALELAKRLKADTEEIISVKDRRGILGYMVSGREAMKRQAAEIKEMEKDPKEYDLVIIGTPIWSWNMSSPIRAFLQKNKSIAKVAFFCTMSGSGDVKCFTEMEGLSKKPVATLSLLTREVVKDAAEEKLKSFVKRIKTSK